MAEFRTYYRLAALPPYSPTASGSAGSGLYVFAQLLDDCTSVARG
jgi:hypothetical protein